MAYKDLGPDVSQTPAALPANQFSGEEKSFETLVIQEGKPVIDWEVNLLEEVARDHGVRLSNQRFYPSCFLSGDYLENNTLEGSFEFLTPTPGNENLFKIKRQDALVNGWHVRFEYSGTSTPGENEIELDIPPASGTRTDLVILEVWRALIKDGLTANLSGGGLIFRNGNVKAPDAVNFANDIIDPNEAAETSARIQIQYRYRVINGVDLDTFPDGLDDPTVVAHTATDINGGIPADGNVTVLTYSPVDRDSGLWRAGTGSAGDATTLRTVDGFMYAIPVCAVFRRNTDIPSFDRDLNLNGGAIIAAAPTDRPDGLFVDQIVAKDVKDLRKSIARDYPEILQKTTQQAFDNSLTTQHEIDANNVSGVTMFAKEDVGIGGHSGDPDRVRRFFSDRSYTETVVARVDITGAPTPTAVFDLNALNVAWNPGVYNLIATAPTGTRLVGIKSLRLVDIAIPFDKDALDTTTPYVLNVVYSATGPEIDTATVTFDVAIPTTNIVYAELMIEYPSGNGLYRNVINSYDVWGPDPTTIGLLPAPWIDGTLWTLSSDVTRYSLDTSLWNVDHSHRESLIRIRTVDQIATFYADANDKIYIPERLTGDPITVDDGGGPLPNTNYTYNTAYTEVQLATSPGAGTPVLTTYKAYRPAPDLPGAPADSFQVFFESAAVQSIQPAAGTQTLQLIPRATSNFLYIIANGSGSPDDAFPFSSPGVQIPIPELPTPAHPESILDTPNFLSIIGFGINTGFMQIESKIPYMPQPDEVTIFRDAPDIVEDDDGRFFWPKSEAVPIPPAVPKYSPVVYGQLLSSKQRHKVAFPVLMELAEDFYGVVPHGGIGRKGSLVLVIFTSWFEFDNQNRIELSTVSGDTGAAVYRVRGNLLNPQRTDT
jgi:hypothetical protein